MIRSDTGLPVEPADRLLQRIAGRAGHWPAVQLAVLERQFKGSPFVRHDQL
ncbi:hypothetical protein AB3H01_28075 [Pseudomonas putida]